ncbi:glycosyltransferase family 4 protein [Nocardioides marmotae]|uniref:Glycosyltransferase n=1 Tax=Nocardioides marmotae TaxID=2663857 RepID=A0A6I3J2P7_9ACTN|nr:glycosyltransferase family 4 protein [Nocardioides marmotae]MCR6031137.1 glycosyltransferase [Gordonia jinghuaiqii]MBC9731855.1 glycosyltransferase family 4 protein [Nocardioides marmotae]MTB82974.1 glycosyltransferase [Nocardioides marmotae]MTB94776.1 glycosyltransferase [Nocardioides marmotae]QKE01229.1 glycosyltransferase family 4 protein [Nocardioides marmotae]
MRIAMLSYRSAPHTGGQGIYLRHLTRELANLGHDVEVFSGQPYPELDHPDVRLTKVPSLDLYRQPDPFRVPKLHEFRDRIDVEEFLTMCAAGFPEPKTFSSRVARVLRDRVEDFDIVHDNQVLGYGMLDIEKMGLPLITTLHHPITFDRRIDIAQTRNPWRKFTLWRWYGFLRMQAKVARAARKILTPSEASKRDIAKDFGVDPARMQVILLGVEDGFKPPTKPRVPGRILAMASADAPMKGIATLLEAFAKLRTERDVELVLITKPRPGGTTEKLIDKYAIGDSVRFVSGVSDAELVDLMGSAEVACVPSLYEGFSLPTAELMACATPLVVSRAGAIPEVTGPDGEAADLVTPGDVGELTHALGALLDDPERRARMGAAGRRRVEEMFSWRAVAVKVAAAYEEVIEDYRRERAAGPSDERNHRAHR